MTCEVQICVGEQRSRQVTSGIRTHFGAITLITLVALASCSSGNSPTAGGQAPGNPPATPTGLTADAGDASVKLSWAVDAYAASYNIYRDGAPVGSATINGFTDTGLTDGTTYSYAVAALNGAGASALSAPVQATPVAPGNPPAAPSGLAATPGQATSILSWGPVTGATGYDVYRSLSASQTGVLVGTSKTNTFTDMGLSSGWNASDNPPTTYYYVVTAINAAGVSADSAQVSDVPDYLVPSAPENFVAMAGDAEVALTWTTRQLDATPASSFLIYRDGAQIASVTTTSYTDTGLADGSAHIYAVAAVSGLGQSPCSTQMSAMPLAATATPPSPTGLKAVPGNAAVSLSWNATPGATSYTVYRDGALIGSPVAAAFTDTHLANGTSHGYVVAANNGSGQGPASLQVSATPSGSVPAAPIGLAVTPGYTFVSLAWDSVDTATGYNVYRNGALVGSTLTPGYTDISLNNGTTYSYQVTATNGIGEGTKSAASKATPQATIIPAADAYVRPYSVGFLGDPATLTVYSAANGVAPSGCTWESYGLRCDQTELMLDHVYISGGIYWTGTGSLTITNSIVEGGLGIAAIEAHATAPQANAVITVTDSTLRWVVGQVMPPGNDAAPIWTGSGTQAIVMLRCDSSGMPQGVDPTPGSVIDSNFIHDLFQNYASGGYPNDTHLDGIFSQGGSNIVIQRNYVDAPVRTDTTAALFIQNRTGTDTGIVIYANFLNGGGYLLANQTGLLVDVINNTFASGLYGDVGYYGGSYPSTYGTWTGNVHTDSSAVARP